MNVVIVNCFDTYGNRVDLLYTIFVKLGHDVQVMTSDFCHIEKVTLLKKKEMYNYFSAKPYYKNMSIKRLLSHCHLSKDIFKYLEKKASEIDVLWVLVPPNSFVKDAAKLKKKYPKIRLIFDLIDLWPETMPIAFIKDIWPITSWRNLRNRNLKYANQIVTECKLYQNVLGDCINNKKCTTLYLAKEKKEINLEDNLPKDCYALCYLGSINNIIDIPTIERIVKLILIKGKVRIHIIGDGEKREEFLATIKKTGAEVIYHGKLYSDVEKKKIFDCCHYGLNIMKKTVCVGLTMKSMDYFEAGLPVINNIYGDTWDIIEKENIGVNLNSEVTTEVLTNYDYSMRSRTRSFFEENLGFDSFERIIKEIILEN